MNYSQNKIAHYIFVTVLILLVIAGLSAKFSMASKRSLNSDQVVLAMYQWDVLENKNWFFKNWHLSRNSLIFTDFPVHFVSGLIFGISPFIVRISPFIMFTAGLLIFSLIIFKVYGGQVALLSAVTVLSSSLFSSYFLILLSHGGAIALSFLSLLLVILIAEEKDNNKRTKPPKIIFYHFLLLAVSVLAVFSDSYYMFIFCIPVAVSLTALKFTGKRMNTIRMAVLILIIAASIVVSMTLRNAASLLGAHMLKASTVNLAPPERIPQNLITYLQSISELFNVNLFFDIAGALPKSILHALDILNPDMLIIKLSNLIMFAIIFLNIFLIIKREENATRKMLSLYFLTLAMLLSMAFIFSTMASLIVHARYLIPLIYVFAFFLALSVAGDYRISNPMLRSLVLIIFMLTSAYNIYAVFQFRQEQSDLKLSEFLERNNLAYGYSGYWHSNIITFLSGNKVKVRAVKYDKAKIEPLLLISKSDWYDSNAFQGQTFLMVPKESNKPEFGLLGLSSEQVSRIFGKPDKVISFENMEIYVWPLNIMRR